MTLFWPQSNAVDSEVSGISGNTVTITLQNFHLLGTAAPNQVYPGSTNIPTNINN